MTRRQIQKLLNQHADRLVAGQAAGPKLQSGSGATEPTSVERTGLSAEEQQSLSSLMQLARRVQSVLAEVEPSPSFVTDLRSRLVTQRGAEGQPAANGGRGMLWLAGVAGALSVAGLGFLSYRVARAGAGWISAAAASRTTRPALPKA